MNRVLPFVEAFLADKLINSNTIISNKSKVGMLLLGLAIISLAGSLILIIIGGYHWLSSRYAADMAALIAGSMVLAMAAIFGLVGYALIHTNKSRIKSLQDEIVDSVMQLLEAVSDELELPERIRDNPKITMAIATILGFLAARRIL